MTPKNTSADTIHVVFTPYDLADTYNRHVGAAITSLLTNCSMPVIIHLLYDESLNKSNEEYNINKQNYMSFQDRYDVQIQFHHVSIPEWYHSLRGAKILSVGTYYRLFIPDVLPDISKVIYLDGDIIITLDLNELWGVDITDVPLAARIDPSFQRTLKNKPHNIVPIYHKLSFTKEDLLKYFNAGILYMNLDYIRSHLSLSDEGGAYLQKYLQTPRADQDALNFLFKDTFLVLPREYNLFAYEIPSSTPSACIHYVTRKPWKTYKEPVDMEYWKYLFMSPWCPNPETFIKYICAVGNSSTEALNITMSQIPIAQLTPMIIRCYIQRVKQYFLLTGKIN